MMPTDRFEGRLPKLLSDLAEPRTPDYVDDLLWQTAHTTQRPAWTFLERWLPMDVVLHPVQVPRIPRYLALLAILVLIATIAFAVVGSLHRVPAPFGLAGNGVIAFTTAAGDIVTGDPWTGVTTPIVSGPELDSAPTFSLDGTRIAFVRKVEDMVRVFAVDSSGGEPKELTTAALSSVAWLRWSPDGSRLAWLSEGSLWIAATDGSDAHRVDTGLIIRDEIAWRPPAGAELLVRGLPEGAAAYGLFLVKPDGSSVRAITALDGGSANYRWLSWAPDGRRVAYSNSKWESPSQSHVLTIDGLQDSIIKPDDGSVVLAPAWSPDGGRLAYVVHRKGIGVAPADDDTPHLTLIGPAFLALPDLAWSPDGTTILAIPQGTGEPWLMDPSGGPGVRVPWSASDFPRNRGSWSEWQRLAP